MLFASEKSAGKTLVFCGTSLEVKLLNKQNILAEKVDFAFFSAGESVAREFADSFVESGAVVIDNSSAFRMEKSVPLVVPEVNFRKTNMGIISNPNCSTIQVVLPLYALKQNFGIRKVDYVTFQAVSGSGNKGIIDLKVTQNGEEPKFYPFKISNNCLPQIGSFMDNGFTSEEMKMINETKKILGDEHLEVSATCVRVPVENCHSIVVRVEVLKSASKEDVINALKTQENVVLFQEDDVFKPYPICQFANNQDKVLIGRVRQDLFNKNVWHFWCVADNVRKGAATNGVQILEKILKDLL